jgi:hypothetical protein
MFNFSLRFAFNFQFISQSWLVHHNGLVLINYLSFVPGFHVLRFLSFHGLPMLPFNWFILKVDIFLCFYYHSYLCSLYSVNLYILPSPIITFCYSFRYYLGNFELFQFEVIFDLFLLNLTR